MNTKISKLLLLSVCLVGTSASLASSSKLNATVLAAVVCQDRSYLEANADDLWFSACKMSIRDNFWQKNLRAISAEEIIEQSGIRKLNYDARKSRIILEDVTRYLHSENIY